MGKVVFDTDVFIEIFNENKKLFDFITENIALENIATTVVTEAELMISSTNRETQNKIEKYLADVRIFHISNASTIIFSNLIKKYHLSHSIKIADGLIAAICIANDFPLFTLNTKDFKYIPNLKLIDHNLRPVKLSQK